MKLPDYFWHFILLVFIGVVIVLLVITFGIGWDCLLHNVNCPETTNLTG